MPPSCVTVGDKANGGLPGGVEAGAHWCCNAKVVSKVRLFDVAVGIRRCQDYRECRRRGVVVADEAEMKWHSKLG